MSPHSSFWSPPPSVVTLNCTDNSLECHRSCPGVDCPDYAAPPPPPLPLAPAAVDHRLPVRLLLTVSLLSAFLFLSLGLATLLLYRRRRALRRRRRAATAPLPHGDGFGDGGDEEAGGGGGVVHHVWYIRTVGLDEATIASIATKEYRGVGTGGDCAVCLGEFSDGELVRLLPRCSHPFHAPCIDTWLRAHVSCPICRSVVVVPSGLPAAATDAETEGGQVEERQVFDEMSPSESLPEGSEDSDASSDTQSDIQSEDTEVVAEENGSATPKPIRRSASMDSPLFLVVVPEVQGGALQANRKLPSGRPMSIFRAKEKEAAGTSSSSCQAGGFRIGRSMSSSGRGLFFARNGRSTGNVLPL
ncbi:E3 ubiquitin-protein ligase RING1-like [Hordeum vulgare]|uniref:RING-type E3 ubiquitin transferase n=1 Tax=Hordeum vulgare subsp. vulgare TaxID=112509 RepID=F2D3A2_HORVV|nr:E3 ubiquitin-protein ligase RING1-like [Hordeum vulgare subsp. vulgare]KAE8820376.1 E3 ubiquitin-protein ligase RING1-like [Hordeum vulgare]KAI4989985.1 hypothetical protein ZWY2020_038348 [Hordeum vulgare]BAJ89573.1 predicted protein [Hordeum vulgare subsp. vulgare]